MTLTIDVAAADLLLDAEIVRFSEALPSEQLAPRRYRLTGELLRRAAESLPLTDIDAWFIDRTGQPLSPAGRLVSASARRPLRRLQSVSSSCASRRLNLPMASCNGRRPRKFVSERLGPTIVAVGEENLVGFRSVLSEVGIGVV